MYSGFTTGTEDVQWVYYVMPGFTMDVARKFEFGPISCRFSFWLYPRIKTNFFSCDPGVFVLKTRDLTTEPFSAVKSVVVDY